MYGRQNGFTLIELLVVIVVIAILAAVAVPVFIRQREKGYAAQTQSALKNAATAVEAHATEHGGSYQSLDSDPALAATLRANGFVVPGWATAFDVVASSNNYCIEIRHGSATAGTPWRRATYFGSEGAPQAAPDNCPAAPSL